MSYDEILSGKISLISAFKLSWQIYMKVFPVLAVLLLFLVIPVNMIYHFGMAYFTTSGNLSPNLAASANIGWALVMNPFLLLVNLAIMHLLYSFIQHGKANIVNALLTALKKWIPALLTMALVSVVIFAPAIILSLVTTVLVPAIQSKAVSITLAVLLAIMGAALIPYVFYFSVNFIFFPLAVLLRGKWLADSLRYSKSLVKTRWWFSLLMILILTILPILLATINQRLTINFAYEIISVVILALVSSFLVLPYIIYFLNFEKLNGIQAE